jgi:glutamate synthase (NADPH/NADH) small chain
VTNHRDIQSARLDHETIAEGFCKDAIPSLTNKNVQAEASRCLFCHDAPCVEACPTDIDIPNFIRKIQTGNNRGAAMTILSENIMGGTCARVCPVEVLCEKACVRNTAEDKPVEIGRLQRFATDYLFNSDDSSHPFKRASSSDKSVAIVGAGPAGLACAHRLAMRGHNVTVYESQTKPGGLNEYGLAEYKVPNNWAQQEIDFILGMKGITLKTGTTLGKDVTLDRLQSDFDAVFIGIGLPDVRQLGIPGEDLEGVYDAVDAIAEIRQAGSGASESKAEGLSQLPVGKRVVVIGGGSTAVDIAVQSKRLGAEDVTMLYRRGFDRMSATDYEIEFTQKNDVFVRYWARPVEILGENGAVTAVRFEKTTEANGKFEGTGETFDLPADAVFKAVGQLFSSNAFEGSSAEFQMDSGKLFIDDTYRTSVPGVWAGGDSVPRGNDLTVYAVQDGKKAAESIHRWLGEDNGTWK